MDFYKLRADQQAFLSNGGNTSISARKAALLKLKSAIQQRESAIIQALYADMQKSEFEAYSSEIGFVYQQISHTLKHIDSWAKPKSVRTGLSLFPSSAKIHPQPFGKVLIIAPWNYPFQLLIAPLIAAIAAGNTALLKPSELTPHTSKILAELIAETFETEYIALIEGEGHTVVPAAIDQYVPNLIFFTGSTAVGRIIAKAAAEHLIPCILELGGKSPCIIHKTANLSVAAQRIALGKGINAGQTCVAPDYFIVHESVKDAFIAKLKDTFYDFYYKNDQLNEYTQIVNEYHFQRLQNLLNGAKIIFGGNSFAAERRIEPTLVEGDSQHPLMQEEIFGPISPVFTFTKTQDIYDLIQKHPNPLSLYVFTDDKRFENEIIQNISFGGGCVNNTLMHLVDPNLPFGGIGNSGSGAYHGEAGFNAFSHQKSVVKTANWFDLRQKYPPYNASSLKIIRWFLR